MEYCPRCIEDYEDEETGEHIEGTRVKAECVGCLVCHDCEHMIDCPIVYGRDVIHESDVIRNEDGDEVEQ